MVASTRRLVDASKLDVVVPAPRGAWTEVVASDPDVLAEQTPQWVDAMCAGRRWVDASRLYVTASGRRLVVPMVRSRLPAAVAVEGSMPAHWGFGGVIAEEGVDVVDVEFVYADLARRRVVRQTIRPNPLQGDLWQAAARTALQVPRCAHVLDISAGADAVWKAFRSNVRRGIRVAERAGVEIERDDTGRLLPEYFELVELSRTRWAAQQNEPLWLARQRYRLYDTLDKWQRIARHLGPACVVRVARLDGTAVAGTIVLTGTNGHYTRSAMDKDRAARCYANFALHWNAIQDLCAAGARTYHLGESGTSRSLGAFKEQLGARAVPYPEVRIERLPISSADRIVRQSVKRLIGFRDRR
jgi:hypothetical protein